MRLPDKEGLQGGEKIARRATATALGSSYSDRHGRKKNLKVYSPSQTETWLQCPVKRYLRSVQGWVPKVEATGKLQASIVGKGFAAGVALWNLERRHREMGFGRSVLKNRIQDALNVGKGEAELNFEALTSRGVILQPADSATTLERINKALTAYCTADPLPPTWRIVTAEETLTEHGMARPDLVLRDDLGLAVLDYKVKMRMDDRSRLKVIAEYGNLHQTLHYAWALTDVMREQVQRYYICLVVCEPKLKIEVLPYEVNPETLRWWEAGMREVWARMEAEEKGLAKPWPAAQHFDQWGRCEYEEACFRLRCEPSLMRMKYTNTKETTGNG
jgi:hypothetical protein